MPTARYGRVLMGAVPRIGDVADMPTAAVGIPTPRISDVACGDMPTAARPDRRHRFDGVSRLSRAGSPGPQVCRRLAYADGCCRRFWI